MFVWLASYPKSGNTLTRSLLAAYFFSEDGIFNFELIKNIKQFPKTELFSKMGIDIKNEKEVIKNYIRVQEIINEKKNIQFLKTHSYLFNFENNPFTNLENSLGVIYIARDPRNIILSYANHNSKTQEESAKDLIKGRLLGEDDHNQINIYPGTWGGNFNSWKSFKNVNKYLLVKYEDLIKDKEKSFYEILKFIYNLKKVDFNFDKKKFQNVIESTSFERMQDLEKNEGFDESMLDNKTGKKIKFFSLGKKRNWKGTLNEKIKNQIEVAFKKEMQELGYLK
jgi:hypothetical protein